MPYPHNPTKYDAQALVKEVVKFAKASGKDKFFDEVRNPKGKFHYQEGTKKGLYIFVYDEKGVVLAHGVRLELTGKNRSLARKRKAKETQERNFSQRSG